MPSHRHTTNKAQADLKRVELAQLEKLKEEQVSPSARVVFEVHKASAKALSDPTPNNMGRLARLAFVAEIIARVQDPYLAVKPIQGALDYIAETSKLKNQVIDLRAELDTVWAERKAIEAEMKALECEFDKLHAAYLELHQEAVQAAAKVTQVADVVETRTTSTGTTADQQAPHTTQQTVDVLTDWLEHVGNMQIRVVCDQVSEKLEEHGNIKPETAVKQALDMYTFLARVATVLVDDVLVVTEKKLTLLTQSISTNPEASPSAATVVAPVVAETPSRVTPEDILGMGGNSHGDVDVLLISSTDGQAQQEVP